MKNRRMRLMAIFAASVLSVTSMGGIVTVHAEEAVEEYEGNLLFVSHDRYFIDRFATRIWMLEGGRITDFKGS